MIKRILTCALGVVLIVSLPGAGGLFAVRTADPPTAVADLLTIALKNCAGVKDKELALEILKLDSALGKLPKDDEEKLLAVAYEQVCLARLNCYREVQRLLVNILKIRHRLTVLELQDDLYRAEKQACQTMFDLGHTGKEELLIKKKRHADNQRELNRQRNLLASYEARQRELCGDWQPVISPAALTFPRPDRNEKIVLSKVINTDREVTELLAKMARLEAELAGADPYFTPANELKRLELEAAKVANRLATRKKELETSLNDYLADIARLEEQRAELVAGLSQKEEALAEGRIKLERGLTTKRAVESLVLELEGRLLEILEVEFNLYLAGMDLYIYIGQVQYWWENVEGQREGL